MRRHLVPRIRLEEPIYGLFELFLREEQEPPVPYGFTVVVNLKRQFQKIRTPFDNEHSKLRR